MYFFQDNISWRGCKSVRMTIMQGAWSLESLRVDFLLKDELESLAKRYKKKSTSGTEASTEANAKYGFLGLGGNVTVSGKVTSARENTRSTNQSAKYQVKVYARQQEPTEGCETYGYPRLLYRSCPRIGVIIDE